MPKAIDPEFKAFAIHLVRSRQTRHETRKATVEAVALALGLRASSVQRWLASTERTPVPLQPEASSIRELRREVADLAREVNGIKAAAMQPQQEDQPRTSNSRADRHGRA